MIENKEQPETANPFIEMVKRHKEADTEQFVIDQLRRAGQDAPTPSADESGDES